MRTTLLPVLLLLACGPQKAGESSSSGADDTGATTDTTNTPTTAPTTTTTDTSTTDTPTTNIPTMEPATVTTDEPLSCEMFRSDKLGPSVAVTFIHEGTTPVWVPSVGCGSSLPKLQILDIDQVDIFFAGSNCFPFLCDDFLTLGSCTPGCDDCSGSSNIRIDPGAKFVVNWPGGRVEELEMPAGCGPGVDCQGTCVRAQKAAQGAYDFVLPAFRACTGACECTGENGLCPLPDPSELGEPTSFKASILYPQNDAVDLLITD